MNKGFLKRMGALCTGAVLTLGTFSLPGSKAPAAAADANYARLLQYSMYFYDANMCGSDVESSTGMNWRGNCHTADEVTGGYHDAGDHAMFGLPQGYTAAALGLSYYEFKDAYEATGQADHIKLILNRFATFFRNSTKLNGDNVSNFLYQKGDGTVDHSYWNKPENQDRMQGARKMFWTSSGASDIAANYAAALALNYKNFGNADDLKYAKALYNFSKQYNQCATDGPHGFYNSSVCADEQAMAAGCLALATGEDTYKQAVKNINSLEVHWCYGWNDANLGAAVMNGIVNGDWSAASGFLNSKCNGSNYLFMDKWGSARLNCSMQFMALVATAERQGNYIDWAKGQMNYILGSNPANTCFVTGYASNSAKNAHHRGASGYTSYEQFNMNGWNPEADHMNPFCQYGSDAKPLIGALVGGPCNANGDYHDNMADYVCNEVAIDYNAGLVGAAAGLYHFSKSGSTDSTINGVKKIYSGSSVQPGSETEEPQQTTVYTPDPGPISSDGKTYTLKVGKSYNYDDLKSKDALMIGFKYEDFGLSANSTEKIQKVEVNISANGNIGTYQGAFGTSTKIEADGYWAQDEDQGAVFQSNKGTITWDTPSKIADIIQYGYGGELKVGFWWLDNHDFTIDSIVITTDGSGSVQHETTTEPVVTTTEPEITTTEPKNPQASKLGDVDCDGDITVADAVLLARFNAEDHNITVSSIGKVNADCDGKAGVTADDLTAILEYLAGMGSGFKAPQ